MIEVIIICLLVLNLLMLAAVLFFVTKSRKKPEIEIKYFEDTETLSGALKDTKKVTIKGQVHVDGLPIGGQFIVAETSIEKFNYEKLQKFREEVLKPIVQIGVDAALALKGLPSKRLLGKALKVLGK